MAVALVCVLPLAARNKHVRSLSAVNTVAARHAFDQVVTIGPSEWVRNCANGTTKKTLVVWATQQPSHHSQIVIATRSGDGVATVSVRKVMICPVAFSS